MSAEEKNLVEGIDIGIAVKKLHRMQLEEGDLGAAYWLSISGLIQNAAKYRERAMLAEEKLRKIRKLCQ
ncbi:hypothetical protein [Herbaspirillum sp. B65]|uniref:hypothetical protein n=1 Tax=Herbaspirillum sp. B65 TaxID=137708 RepID=UPI0009FE27B7|nr:hypothetical protein [Herbaspirillum sp. B65]